MVKIRVTVTVLPENVYLAAQDGQLSAAARSAQARKFMVPCEAPEAWTIGQFANRIRDVFYKTYRGEDLGTIKYIKDEDDADLHTDLSVYDALVNAGAEAMNIHDQRAKITIIQEQGLPLRGGSVVPDLSARRHQIPRPPPPPPPLFSSSSQAQPSARKRSRDAAFGRERASPYWHRSPPDQRSEIDTTRLDVTDYEPIESVEHDAVEQNDQAASPRRGASIDLAQDARLSGTRRAADIGDDRADHRARADVEPNSESPNPQVPLHHLEPNSRLRLEVLESATTPNKDMLQPGPSIWDEEQDDALLHRFDGFTKRRISRGSASTIPMKNASAVHGATASDPVSVLEATQFNWTACAPLPTQVQLQTRPNPLHVPITPPSDASPANMRGRLLYPPTESFASTGATNGSNKFKPPVPRRDVFEPQSSIEDSQMSPQPKKKNEADGDTDATSTGKQRAANQSRLNAANATLSFNGMTGFDDPNTPLSSGQLARQEPIRDSSRQSSFLSDVDNDRQNDRGDSHHELEATVPVHGTRSEALSAHQCIPGSHEKNVDPPKALSSLKYHPSRPPLSGKDSASLSTERLGSSDQTDADSNKENRLGNYGERSSDVQMYGHVPDTEMEDVSSGNKEILSPSGTRRPGEDFDDFEPPKGRTDVPVGRQGKEETIIDILNGGGGGGLVSDELETSGGNKDLNQTSGTSMTDPIELRDNASLANGNHAKRQRRKKKSNPDGDVSPFGRRATPLKSSTGKGVVGERSAAPLYSLPGGASHTPNHESLQSERQTPTSTGSAGDQLQASLQASTMEKLSINDGGRIPSHASSAHSVARLESRPDTGKVYEGEIVAIEADNARVALKGAQSELYGRLHRNAIFEQPIKGPLSNVLSLQQMVKVKVTRVKNGDIKLSLRGVDQPTGLLTGAVKKDQKPERVPNQTKKQDRKPFELASDLQMASHAKGHIDSLGGDDGGRTNLEERLENKGAQLTGTGTGEAPNGETEIIRSIEQAEAPDNDESENPHSGLGFSTTSPSKQMPAVLQGAGTRPGLVAQTLRSSHQQPTIEAKGVPSVRVSRTEHKDIQEAATSPNGASPSISAAQSKATSRKSRSKVKPKENQAKSPDSIRGAPRDVEQANGPPRHGSSATRDEPKVSVGDDASLTERPSVPVTVEVADEEYIAFPPTMTREQFLAQRQANAEAIARRNAAAAKGKAAASSGPAEAQMVAQSARSAVNKKKEKTVGGSALASTLETPRSAVHLVDTTNTKKKSGKSRSGDEERESQGLDQPHSGSGQKDTNGRQIANAIVPSAKAPKISKSQDVEQAQRKSAALDSQVGAKSTPSRSTPAIMTKVSDTTSGRTAPKPSPTLHERVLDAKAGLAKPVTAKNVQAGTRSNSKALSLAELKAQKEAAKKSNKALSGSLTPYRSTPTASAPRTALTTRSDSDESDSESESSSDDTTKQKSSAAALKKRAFQKVVSRPDPTIRDRSLSVDADDDDGSD